MDDSRVLWLLVLIPILFYVGTQYWGVRLPHRIQIDRPPGVAVAEDPLQTAPGSGRTWRVGRSKIVPLARFHIRGLVLMNVPYRKRGHDEFQLSPLDLVLGWGPMSDSRIVNGFDMQHGYRFVEFKPRDPNGLSIREAVRHLSHIHALPADDALEQRLHDLRVGEIATLDGSLVSVEMPGFMPWTSSLSRTDSGCEIMWIEAVAD